MTDEELKSYLNSAKKYSPFFQKENLYKNTDPEKIIKDLYSTKKIDFFMGYVPLSTSMNAYISIFCNIVLKIKANEDQYKEIGEDLFQQANSMFKNNFQDIEKIVDQEIDKYKKSTQLNYDIEKFLENNKIEKNDQNIEIAKDILINKYTATFLKNETEKLISENFDKIVNEANKTQKEKIEFKDPKQSAKSDYIIMGAPASGKGAITNKLFTEDERKNSIVLNPDGNRIGVGMLIKRRGFTDEEIKFNNMIMTADFANCIQDNILNLLKNDKNISTSIIIDQAYYKKEVEGFLRTDNTKIVIAAYYGHPTYESGVNFRDTNRGDNAHNIVDKRYYETEDILGIHKRYMNSFVSGAPFKFDVEIVDVVGKDLTGEWGKPSTIATISSETNQLKINDPIAFVEFVNKSNINEKAKHPIEVSLLNKNPQEKIDAKIKAFENFCKIAEDRGLKIDGKEKVISDFREREERIIGSINQSSSSSISKS